MFMRSALLRLGSGALLCAFSAGVLAIQDPGNTKTTAPQVFVAAPLQVDEQSIAASRAGGALRARADALPHPETAQVDRRTGRFITLTPGTPLLPGRGAGNALSGLAPTETRQLQRDAWQALRGWLVANAGTLELDVDELAEQPRVTVLSPDYLQVWSERFVDGIRVRGAELTATIKYGNLVIFGMNQWGDVPAARAPKVSEAHARAAMVRRVGAFADDAGWKASELVWVPVTTGDAAFPGLGYRLAWIVRSRLGQVDGRYEVIVDADTGEVLAVEDTIHYAETPRTAVGGVYPLSNDGVAPDGVEQPGWPMPYLDVTVPAPGGGTRVIGSNAGGALPQCIDGSISAGLRGKYVTMNDNCGTASLAGTGSLDFGTSSGIDCKTPGFGGTGNTHASRTAFYELNRLIEQARSRQPTNAWLQSTLTANVNVQQTCNAGWDGSSVTFFRSGGGCSNTGEIAAVFDHEWGHGLDDNDGVPTVSSPGEGIADIYGSLRLNDSCIGRNFRPGSNCSGETAAAGACTACTGVRDIDWAKHVGADPFTLADADTCGLGNSQGPCGGSVHCEGQVYSQAVWDLWNRDLTGAPHNLDRMVTREIAAQLTFRGASGVSSWFACTNGSGGCGNASGCGCAATAGYMQYLTADDDNGNLADGTPHMGAINEAFARHQIACATPAVTTSTCTSPSQAPVVTATPIDSGVSLSWTPSAGATEYRVFRTDGVRQCDYGKEILTTTSGTTFLDGNLQNGRPYSYIVVPLGAADECPMVASTCATATPVAGAATNLVAESAVVSPVTGDGDISLDNCETAQYALPFANTGTGAATNVRILSVVSTSHPDTEILTPMPIVVSANQASCALANGNFQFIPEGLAPNDTITFAITYTSDELGALTRTATVSTSVTETDIETVPSKTFTFETNAEGWATTSGVFQRDTAAGGGSDGSLAYMRSSTNLNDQCDVVFSPSLVLAPDSTLTMSTRFAIEAQSGGQWWDRANVGVRPAGASARTIVNPSSGRLYNASGIGGTCGTDLQGGWAGTADSWASSSWTASALQSATFAGQPVKLELHYGTDSSLNGFGFRFDTVTVTNVGTSVPDAQSNVCTPPPDDMFLDGFETPPPK